MKKKRERIKGRTAAILGMVLMIGISTPIGMGVSLVRERNNVSDLYYGSYSTFGLLEDISYCSRSAANLATLGGKYLSAEDACLTDLQKAVKVLETAQLPGEKADAYAELTIRVNAMYNALSAENLSEQDEEYREELYADYSSGANLISYSDYNLRAAEFNETFRRAPGRPIAVLLGVKELELFA